MISQDHNDYFSFIKLENEAGWRSRPLSTPRPGRFSTERLAQAEPELSVLSQASRKQAQIASASALHHVRGQVNSACLAARDPALWVIGQ